MADTHDIAVVLNRIADEITAHLAWMRKRDEQLMAQRQTFMPPLDYAPSEPAKNAGARFVAGRPVRDGDTYGIVERQPFVARPLPTPEPDPHGHSTARDLRSTDQR